VAIWLINKEMLLVNKVTKNKKAKLFSFLDNYLDLFSKIAIEAI
jgi:hypothetical protein